MRVTPERVLPDGFVLANDPQRRERFQRLIEQLAVLDRPASLALSRACGTTRVETKEGGVEASAGLGLTATLERLLAAVGLNVSAEAKARVSRNIQERYQSPPNTEQSTKGFVYRGVSERVILVHTQRRYEDGCARSLGVEKSIVDEQQLSVRLNADTVKAEPSVASFFNAEDGLFRVRCLSDYLDLRRGLQSRLGGGGGEDGLANPALSAVLVSSVQIIDPATFLSRSACSTRTRN